MAAASLGIIGHRYHLRDDQRGLYDALERQFDVTLRFVDDGWPSSIDDLGLLTLSVGGQRVPLRQIAQLSLTLTGPITRIDSRRAKTLIVPPKGDQKEIAELVERTLAQLQKSHTGLTTRVER